MGSPYVRHPSFSRVHVFQFLFVCHLKGLRYLPTDVVFDSILVFGLLERNTRRTPKPILGGIEAPTSQRGEFSFLISSRHTFLRGTPPHSPFHDDQD